MPPSKKEKKGSAGLNGMAKLLSEIQHSYLRLKPMPVTPMGNIHTAAKHLKTTFTGSAKGTKKSNLRASIGAVSITPPAHHLAASESNARSSSRIARQPRLDASSLVPGARDVATRLNTAHVNLSSTLHGTKKITIREILSLR